jgi:predicted secreted protein
MSSMNPISAIAVYFIIWWLVLFIILPLGVRNAHEAGDAVEEGNDAGAPVNPRLLRKAIQTTILATIVFIFFIVVIRGGMITFDDIPFLGGAP